MIYFKLPFKPLPRGRHRIDFRRRIAYKDPVSREYEKLIAQYINDFVEIPFTMEGPLAVDLKFHLKRPKSVKRKFPHVKPDLDNLAKGVLDALEVSQLIKNDAQIINLSLKKEYSDEEMIEVSVAEVLCD